MPSSRLNFWLLAGLIALAAAGKPILYDTLDPDCFWHLRVAEQLHRDGIGPLTDELAFASDKTPWTPYSWLAELGMKGLWDVFGWRGAVAVHAMLNASFVLLIALGAQLAGGERRLSSSVLLVALGAAVSLAYLSFRPATLAIVLLAGVMCLIQYDRIRNHESRRIWLIIPLTMVLANVHLFAFLVPLWFGALLIGNWIDGGTVRRRSWALLGVALVAACCTPMLAGVVKTLVYYQFNDPMVAGSALAEMRPIYRGAMGWVWVLLIVVAMIPILRHPRRLGASEWMLLGLGLLLLCSKGRYTPLFAITATPVLMRACCRGEDVTECRPRFAGLAAALAMLMAAFVFRLVTAFPGGSTDLDHWLNRHGPQTPGYPTGAANFVRQSVSPRTGRIINEFTWGGYLAWRLRGFQTLMDGRTQCFSGVFWRQTCLGAANERQEFLRGVRADAALLPRHKSLFARHLIEEGWRVAYVDDRAQVLLPPGAVARIDR